MDMLERVGNVGVIVKRDGNEWCAHRPNFIDMMESPVGFGASADEAICDFLADEEKGVVSIWREDADCRRK